MEFIKMHGLGNDFICLDHFHSSSRLNYSETARLLCDRRFGVGGDGVVVILRSGRADARMRIFNPDGTEPEMCGNGIRCLARYLYDSGYVRKDSIMVETLAGILAVDLEINNGLVCGITVNMGEPCLEPVHIPVGIKNKIALREEIEVSGQKFLFSAVSMGNPHCVIRVEDLDRINLDLLGPAIEGHSLFPNRTNVEFVRVDSPREVTLKVWERGAGATLACGTGACATVVALVLEGQTGSEVLVHQPGGDLKIEWRRDSKVYMTGPANYVFQGNFFEQEGGIFADGSC